MNAYESLIAYVRETRALSTAAGILSWDQEVMMPPSGAAARAEQMGALEAAIHKRRTDGRVADLLAKAEAEQNEKTAEQSANLRLIAHETQRASRIPADLAQAIAHKTAIAQGVWAKARATNDVALFLPHLAQIVDLRRQEAAAVHTGDGPLYDALLDVYEPGMTVAQLQPLLEGLRPRLTALRAAIAEKGRMQPNFSGSFDRNAQLALANAVAEITGYDFAAGRLDLSVHPFSSGSNGDVRITTRVDEADPAGCLYSTIHELGHALYEQGLPAGLEGQPAGASVSMGVHESQSRLWENQIGRSAAFCAHLYPLAKKHLGDMGLKNEAAFHQAVNRVETGFIRTEADEVHYNLHVLLRFELERDLIGGTLEVADLEEAWNSRFERDFGLVVPDAAHGLLQDVHWSVGLFGYFPTYSLGNIYAAQLNEALRKAVPDLDDQLKRGETGAVLGWLRQNVHSQASLYAPGTIIERASGTAFSSEPLLDYLESKYGALFDL